MVKLRGERRGRVIGVSAKVKGFSAPLSRAGSPWRCNYHVSSGAYSPGVFNLVLFVSQRDLHFFSGVGAGRSDPGLKLINQQGFTSRRLPPRSRRAAFVQPAVSGAEGLGEPSEGVGSRSGRADASPAAFNPLALNFPFQPSHSPESLGVGVAVGGLHLLRLVLRKGTGSLSSLPSLNFGRIVPLINGIVKLLG